MAVTTVDPAVQAGKKAAAFCREQALFRQGERVIVACSGGADSMALLLFMLNYQREFGVSVSAAHVNHGLRGALADADEAFVRAFCSKHGVELLVYNARENGETPPHNAGENWARRLRYGWFDALAKDIPEVKIATAHTLTDQLETVLFRMARGTGLHGMRGIPVKRGPYVRPFLCLTREETAAYCAAHGQSYVQDETNADVRFARNRLRRDALPALRQANPQAEQAVGRLCRQMTELDLYFAGKAEELLTQARIPGGGDAYRLEMMRQADALVLRKALYLLASPWRDMDEPVLHRLHRLVESGSGAVQLTETVRFCADGRIFWAERERAEKPQFAPIKLTGPGRYPATEGRSALLRLENYEDFLKNTTIFKKGSNCCADYAKIQKNAELRTRRPGDAFRPAGRGITKKLKKFFNEQHVPPQRRGQMLLLAADDQVLWLEGFGFADGLQPGRGTRQVLYLEIEASGGVLHV